MLGCLPWPARASAVRPDKERSYDVLLCQPGLLWAGNRRSSLVRLLNCPTYIEGMMVAIGLP